MWDLEGGMWHYVLAAVLDIDPSEVSVLAVTPVDASEEYIERTMVAFALIHFPIELFDLWYISDVSNDCYF